MGAAYVLTGSINQACIEAGTSETVRTMLAGASQADVTMAPAADMFEMGVKVQVLKRGTMFPFRAAKLYDFYSRYDALEDIPEHGKTASGAGLFLAVVVKPNGNKPRGSSIKETRGRSCWPKMIRSIRWRSCFAHIWGNPPTGPNVGNRHGKSIIRFGVDRLWGPSMNGPRGPFWKNPKIARW